MKLYLVRHGEAMDAQSNPERPLSEMGASKIETFAQVVGKHSSELNLILHSPKLRASQTAEIFAKHLNPASVKAQADMLPSDSIQSIIDLIDALTHNTMLVGHLPYLSFLALELTRATIHFEPGQCVCLEGVRDNWTIEWVMMPTFFI